MYFFWLKINFRIEAPVDLPGGGFRAILHAPDIFFATEILETHLTGEF